MRVHPVKTEFKPVSFTFVFETQKELDRWGSLFNFSSFSDAMGCGEHYKAFKDVGAEIEEGRDFSADDFSKAIKKFLGDK